MWGVNFESHDDDGSSDLQGMAALVLMQPMNKELCPNVQWGAERFPTELPRS